jgi:glycosyltransferase involved in cell wall biosynthesis
MALSPGPARAIYRAIFRRANIVAVSEYTAKRVETALGTRPPIVLSGVDYDFYQPLRPRPEKRGPTILAVGAVKKRKGIHSLVGAMARVRERIADAQCVVVGKIADRGYIHRLRDLISADGLEDCFHLTGILPYEDIVGWYQNADVFALPSRSGESHFEGFGLVILEAGACGLPAIGTRDSGNESAIVDGETGYLIDQKDTDALAARIGEVLADADLRARLGQGAREFAREHSWERSAQKFLSFYEDVLARHGRETR